MTDDAVTKSSRPNEKVGFAWTGTGVNTFLKGSHDLDTWYMVGF
jgi:hypothetical protein